MFKRLSIFAVILSALVLGGCANQQSTETHSNAKSEQTPKSTKKSAKKTPKKKKSARVANSTRSASTESEKESSNDSNSESNGNSASQSTSQSTDNQNSSSNQSTSTNQNDNNNDTKNSTTDSSQDSQNQDSQAQQSVNITTSTQAVEYLADQLSSTYDKTTTQYVANGKISWNNTSGYQINIYSKNSDTPVGSYLVPANGQYFQIW
ncbi:hypothetical protein [Companilactobacillus halodurans]|uniref:Lipoprotein n=1 Tax=Companilactobacillus halodurans TaxID=2584183 RepID=A0A5P0ZYK9_9LACO|nr:hypothetical protein [Companilactobacillus halodurans]MQS76671.1 hypothetical protein [Companilactobacillus halodurans]MQS97824.1 hypothetical protein [Companilactobacillus halodurans]